MYLGEIGGLFVLKLHYSSTISAIYIWYLQNTPTHPFLFLILATIQPFAALLIPSFPSTSYYWIMSMLSTTQLSRKQVSCLFQVFTSGEKTAMASFRRSHSCKAWRVSTQCAHVFTHTPLSPLLCRIIVVWCFLSISCAYLPLHLRLTMRFLSSIYMTVHWESGRNWREETITEPLPQCVVVCACVCPFKKFFSFWDRRRVIQKERGNTGRLKKT